MAPGTRRYTVEVIRSGQPKAYADTVLEFVLTHEMIPYKQRADDEPLTFELMDLGDHLIKQAGRAIGGDFTEKKNADWYEPRLTRFVKEGTGKWRFVVTSAYTD